MKGQGHVLLSLLGLTLHSPLKRGKEGNMTSMPKYTI